MLLSIFPKFIHKSKINETDNNVFHEFHVKNMERILILNKLARPRQKKIKGKIILSSKGIQIKIQPILQGSQMIVRTN